jgi:hypothetical protein
VVSHTPARRNAHGGGVCAPDPRAGGFAYFFSQAISDPMSVNPRCERCGDVIGVYEPLVTVREGRVLETSLLSSPDLVLRAPGDR